MSSSVVGRRQMHMTRENKRYDRAVQTLSRRQALAGSATLLTAGGTLLWIGDDARAAVSIGELSIPDASLTGEAVTPVVDVDVRYEYDVGETAIGGLEFALTVGGDEVAGAELVTDRTTYQGTTDLAGRVTDSTAWASADFAPEVASSVSRELTVGLSLAVVEPDGAVLASDSVEKTVTVVVKHPQQSEYTARVGGSGVVRTATDDA